MPTSSHSLSSPPSCLPLASPKQATKSGEFFRADDSSVFQEVRSTNRDPSDLFQVPFEGSPRPQKTPNDPWKTSRPPPNREDFLRNPVKLTRH